MNFLATAWRCNGQFQPLPLDSQTAENPPEGTELRSIELPRMSRKHEQDLDEHLERLEGRLPGWAAKFVRWLRQPNSRWFRLPLGIFLILAGIVGFLPILGFWMVPLGFIVIAKDLPPLQPALVRVLDWAERKWQAK